MGRIRVFHLDNHEVVRRGLAALVVHETDIEIVGEAATVAEATVRIPATRPHVAVLDVCLPDGNGLDVCRALRARVPDLACLVLTSHSPDEVLFDAIEAGVAGFVLKDVRGRDLITAIRQVGTGASLLDPELANRLRERMRRGPHHDERLDALSEQERRILELIGTGMTNRQIGEALHLAEKTVKNYVSSLLAKLDMQRRTQAATFVTRMTLEHRHRVSAAREPVLVGP